MKVSSFFWNVRGLGNHKTVEMLISLLKLHNLLLVFLVEPMMLYINAFDVIFKFINMHLVGMSSIVNKAAKLWCLSVHNLVQNFLVNDQFIFVTCLLHDKCFSLLVFMVLTHTWLDGFCGGILVPSQSLNVFWEILILCSRRMTVKGGVSQSGFWQ